MPVEYAQKYFGSRFQGWTLFGVGLALILHLLVSTVSPSFAQESSMNVYIGRNPQAVMDEFLNDDRPEDIGARVLILSESGDYAIATYIWGETGGYMVMEKDGNQWQNTCGGGGALSGAHDLVNLCDVPLTEAQALWDKYGEDREAAGYAI